MVPWLSERSEPGPMLVSLSLLHLRRVRCVLVCTGAEVVQLRPMGTWPRFVSTRAHVLRVVLPFSPRSSVILVVGLLDPNMVELVMRMPVLVPMILITPPEETLLLILTRGDMLRCLYTVASLRSPVTALGTKSRLLKLGPMSTSSITLMMLTTSLSMYMGAVGPRIMLVPMLCRRRRASAWRRRAEVLQRMATTLVLVLVH